MRTKSGRTIITSSQNGEPEQAEKLSPKQWSAISSLMEGRNMQATADLCDINVRTLRRWLQSADFVEEYNRTRRQHLENVTAHLLSAAADAADTLMRLLKSGDPIVELRAARAILQMSHKGAEMADLKKRMDELERVNAKQEQQIEKLEAANRSLQSSKEELHEMTTSLMAGTFQRPTWLTTSAWEKIVRTNTRIPVAAQPSG